MNDFTHYTCVILVLVGALLAIRNHLRAERSRERYAELLDHLMDERRAQDARNTKLTDEITQLLHDKIYSDDQTLRNHYTGAMINMMQEMAITAGKVHTQKKAAASGLFKVDGDIEAAVRICDVAYQVYREYMAKVMLVDTPASELIDIRAKVDAACRAFYADLDATGVQYK